jgi:hypothetical protein
MVEQPDQLDSSWSQNIVIITLNACGCCGAVRLCERQS